MRQLNIGLLYLLSLSIAGYAVVAYAFSPLGSLVHPDMQSNFVANPLGIYLHIFASAVALACGPFQFSEKIRKRRLHLHRWIGRVYLSVGVLVGGVSGLYMAQFAYGGWVAKLGFATLAIAWLYTGARAYSAIRSGAVAEHKNWMIRNFSLTFAAVMLRLYLPVSMVLGFEFASAYVAIAWLCWVPNLIVAEWRFVKR